MFILLIHHLRTLLKWKSNISKIDLIENLLNYPTNINTGHEWKKKKGSKVAVREDHVQLKVGRVPFVYGCYAHSEESPTFHRRMYQKLPLNLNHTLLVQYLDQPDVKKKKTGLLEVDLVTPVKPVPKHDQSTCKCFLCLLETSFDFSRVTEKDEKEADVLFQKRFLKPVYSHKQLAEQGGGTYSAYKPFSKN